MEADTLPRVCAYCHLPLGPYDIRFHKECLAQLHQHYAKDAQTHQRENFHG